MMEGREKDLPRRSTGLETAADGPRERAEVCSEDCDFLAPYFKIKGRHTQHNNNMTFAFSLFDRKVCFSFNKGNKLNFWRNSNFEPKQMLVFTGKKFEATKLRVLNKRIDC